LIGHKIGSLDQLALVAKIGSGTASRMGPDDSSREQFTANAPGSLFTSEVGPNQSKRDSGASGGRRSDQGDGFHSVHSTVLTTCRPVRFTSQVLGDWGAVSSKMLTQPESPPVEKHFFCAVGNRGKSRAT
jgi:hypothetical protein